MIALSTARLGVAPFYRLIWRWHFYAGLVVAPFLVTLSLTGLLIAHGEVLDNWRLPPPAQAAAGANTALSIQLQAATQAVPGGTVDTVLVPATPEEPMAFMLSAADGAQRVTINPATGVVHSVQPVSDTVVYLATGIHGTLLLGDTGDIMLEVVAGLSIIAVATGLWLWILSGGGRHLSTGASRLAMARVRQIHAQLGVPLGLLLLFFLVSGMAWTSVWGGRIVQAWGTFPASKMTPAPLSGSTHASLNHGSLKQQPWTLEQTPLPMSGSAAGVEGIPQGTVVDLASVVDFARQAGFSGRFKVNLPKDHEGVFTISSNSMEGDSASPTGDRTVHLDQHSGRVLADVRFADYGLGGRAMAVGIALHKGYLGLWNLMLDTLVCVAVVFMAVSGLVMWWRRRPSGRLGTPMVPMGYRAPAGVLVITVFVCLALPLTGLAILMFITIDHGLPARWRPGAA